MLGYALQFIADTFRESQAEQQRRQAELANAPDWEPIAVMIATALALTLRHYFLMKVDIWGLMAAALPAAPREQLNTWRTATENREFVRLFSWTVAQTIGFLIAPFLCCLVLRRSPSEYGWKLQGATRGWPIYLAMYALLLPAILVFSRTEMFQHTYPFYKLADDESLWPRLIAWELLYAWQFITLEFFFRGFMVHGLKRQFGFYSILVMTIPYCMIHFGKPYPETLGSIIAGVALGVMSLNTRSIWMGAALHIAVAWSMDLAALAATGRLGL